MPHHRHDTCHPLTRADIIPALSVALASLALYTRTLVPFPLTSDSAEFQVLIHQLGPAHTTGYSTYLILGHLFGQIAPFGDAAYRANLFSAVMAASTVALVYLTGRLLAGSRTAAAIAALSLAVGFAFWSQALIAEVYTTGAAFLAGVCLLTVLWYQAGRRWAIFLAGLAGAAGLGAHGSLGPFGVAVAIFLLLNWHRRREWLLPGLLGVLAGVGLYVGGMFWIDARLAPANIFNAAYEPARSAWGLSAEAIEDPATRVWFLISAGQWRSAMFTDPLRQTVEHLGIYLFTLPRELFYPTIVLALYGLVRLLRRDRRLAALFWVALLLQMLVYFNYDVGDLYVFFIPTYLLWAMLAAVGVEGALAWVERQPWGSRAAQVATALLIAAVCIVPMLLPQGDAIARGTVPFLREPDFLVERDTENVVKVARMAIPALEENAIVFTDWYWLYAYYYAAHVEAGKTGMQFIGTCPRAERRGLASSVLEFVKENIGSRPIYLTGRYEEFARAGFRLQSVSVGPVPMLRLEAP
jgi:hypothetical protein